MSARPKAFVKGHNVLKKPSTKQLSKVKELEKRKTEEAETAAVLTEYIADFQTAAAGGKAFVRAGIINPDKPADPIIDETPSKIYKPKSKMQELAEEFKKSKEITEEYKSAKDSTKKLGEKKKSNLELFKEELEQSQKERDIRRRIRAGDLSGISEDVLHSLPPSFFKRKTTEDEFGYQYDGQGSHDTGDPSTTNLFVSNLNPKMNEEQLCKVFGRYGPLASVKIMWPRTEEEKSRNRNCGFVAFMTRKDGEKALADIEGKYVMDYEMKIGWGKVVPIPPQPIYVHPSQSGAIRPPKQSGLPFNSHLTFTMKKNGEQFNGNLENTVVKVVIPTERTILSLINRVVEFVVREGPMFEAMIMNREIASPLFRFLFDNKSNEHIYYRWRIFSLLQGDTTSKWNQKCFRMFVGGSIWQPPPINPYANNTMGTSMTASAAIASASSANVHNLQNVLSGSANREGSPTLTMKKNFLLEQLLDKEEAANDEKEKVKNQKSLSDRQRDKLEDLLRTISTDRMKIGDLMMWCIDHADCSQEIVECVCESLSILETPIPIKTARLFLVNDILHNSSAKVPNASSFRKGFQGELLEVMENMHKALATCSTKAQSEKFRRQVLSCLSAWQDWAIYPPNLLIQLQNVFVGIATSKETKEEEEMANKESLKAKLGILGDDDIDGIPFSAIAPDDEVDGVAMDDDDIDGIPLTKDVELESSRQQKKLDVNDPLSKSRWETLYSDDKDDPKHKTDEAKTASKWQKVEGVQKGKSMHEDDKRNENERHQSTIQNSKDASPSEDDEERRKFLRDVEVKVMRFVDKLEQRGGSKTGLNIQSEAEKFRQQLIVDYELSRSRDHKRRGKAERKRDRSRSTSLDRKKKKKKRTPSLSGSDFSSEEKEFNARRGRDSSRFSPPSRGSQYRSTSPKSPIFSDRSRSPYGNRRSRRSPSPLSRRSNLSPSPFSNAIRSSPSPYNRSNRSPSPYNRENHSPSPLSFSPKRLSSSVSKAKKKKAKKSKRRDS